jgi:hypothetical protein
MYGGGAIRIRLGFSAACAVSRSAAPGDDLDRWLTPLVDVVGRSRLCRRGPLYVRGLLGPYGPESVQPIAARLSLRGRDQLHRFVSSPG